MKHYLSWLCFALSSFLYVNEALAFLPLKQNPTPLEPDSLTFSRESYQLAKVTWLPDYLQNNKSGKRVEEKTANINNKDCSSYGLLASCSQNQQAQGLVHPVAGLTCYKECVCDTSIYKYNTTNCKAPKTLGGNTCKSTTSSISLMSKCSCPKEYNLDFCPEGTLCKKCDNKYQQIACADGYILEKDKCIKELNCNDFPLAVCPTDGTCTKCPYGEKLKLDECDTQKGWLMAENKLSCIASDCPAGYSTDITTCSKSNTSLSCSQWSGGKQCCLCKGSPQNAVIFDIVAEEDNSLFRLSLSINDQLSLDYNINWGDGSSSQLNVGYPEHIYAKKGNYTISITGEFNNFRQTIYFNDNINTYITKLHSFAAPSLSYITISNCSKLTGEIPSLPSQLKGIIFDNCKGLTGKVPELPDGMLEFSFSGCSGLTGSIPQLPTSLKSANYGFHGCTGLTGAIPELPNGLEQAALMFSNCTGLTGNIPSLPSSLLEASWMFSGCSGLTGNIPSLPNSLEEGRYMFKDCTNLTGKSLHLPTSLKNGEGMFYGTNLSGSILPDLPDSLENGDYMFENTYISGEIKSLPQSLQTADSMFANTSIHGRIPSFPNGLINASKMFFDTDVSGDIPPLPKSLQEASSMFAYCSHLTGNIPELPISLTSTQGMFNGCEGLTGNIPSFPPSLTHTGWMFSGCSGLTGDIPTLPDTIENAHSMFENCSNLNPTLPNKPKKLTNQCNRIFNQTPIVPTGEWLMCNP